jgi:hypothetical protein
MLRAVTKENRNDYKMNETRNNTLFEEKIFRENWKCFI